MASSSMGVDAGAAGTSSNGPSKANTSTAVTPTAEDALSRSYSKPIAQSAASNVAVNALADLENSVAETMGAAS